MKQIIERKVALNQRYHIIDKKFIPLTESCGTCCDNCGQLIANIATVKNDSGQVFTIGFDCLETLLINNALLSAVDIEEYHRIKKMIPKVLRFAKSIKETIANNSNINITGIKFEKPMEPFFAFHWLKNNQLTGRDNDYVKLKDVDLTFLIEALKNIFPKMKFIY